MPVGRNPKFLILGTHGTGMSFPKKCRLGQQLGPLGILEEKSIN